MAEIDDERQMEQRMWREVAEGIDETKTRAGIIKKVASGNTPYSDWEKKTHQAAASDDSVFNRSSRGVDQRLQNGSPHDLPFWLFRTAD
jgi:hypothetical protein